MNQTVRKIIESGFPFLIVGISIALMIGMLIVFYYVLIWGIIIGCVLALASWIKGRVLTTKRKPKHKGRIIEHDNKD